MAKTFFVYIPALLRQQFFIGVGEIFEQTGGYPTMLGPFCRPLSVPELQVFQEELDRLLSEHPTEEGLWEQLQVLGAPDWPPTPIVAGVKAIRDYVKTEIAARQQ